METMTIKELLKKAAYLLRLSDIDHPNADAELLLAHAIGKPREFLVTHPEKTVSKTHVLRFQKLLKRRRAHEPIAYLLGYKEFYGRTFVVGRDVLIPRQETETLIEAALDAVRSINARPEEITVFDVGTGSGCIALTLTAELPGSRALCADFSEKAITIARENALRLGLEQRAAFTLMDITSLNEGKPRLPPHRTLVLTANLPYLPDYIWKTRARGIKEYEPAHALRSGADGLNHYRALLRRLRSWKLVPDIMLFEADPPQFAPLAKLVQSDFKTHHLSIRKDIRGLDRILIAIRKSTHAAKQ